MLILVHEASVHHQEVLATRLFWILTSDRHICTSANELRINAIVIVSRFLTDVFNSDLLAIGQDGLGADRGIC